MDLVTHRRRTITLLQNEGFRPEIDSDGDIVFKCEGGNYLIISNDDEYGYFQLLYLGFWSMDNAKELTAALLAASKANQQTKVAKIWANGDRDRMHASAEIFLPGPTGLTGGMIIRCISAIQTAVEVFRTECSLFT